MLGNEIEAEVGLGFHESSLQRAEGIQPLTLPLATRVGVMVVTLARTKLGSEETNSGEVSLFFLKNGRT